ncbi:PhoD-like phosphatase [Rubripirellula lacrimiformis]|uniref:PhoD-like phosphatase n=1 Tax=Rubripirellula lacrimiformis TaxID=1930273 RepID=A0A517NH27_9BACT|nr:alkaline phosphatase D family protein [Rubripirellula lacrimiformis]QDT06441.1 PhoD-like phosphatase [Rubripirellula lacrimiformis]
MHKLIWTTVFALSVAAGPTSAADDVFLGQGMMVGEVTTDSALIQTRLTVSDHLDGDGDLAGAGGVALVEYADNPAFDNATESKTATTTADHDFIARWQVDGLRPGTKYHYRIRFGITSPSQIGPTGTFHTLAGQTSDAMVRFVVGSCMNYCKFMYGKPAKASGPITATDEDKQLGYRSFAAMPSFAPEFFVGTGDIVYYDNPVRNAKSRSQMRKCWHEQFRFPRMIDFLAQTPAYWSKDDHDFRFDDADRRDRQRNPSPSKGIRIFREQMPIVAQADETTATYRTHRISRHLQLWFTEGRDYRSLNEMEDGPEKTLWGTEQREWLMRTLAESDATWKILVTPTPMVGPDDKRKTDNHTNLGGFRHEADAFFQWIQQNQISGFLTICGDRHWQYHSIHPSGIEEFACGALNDENSRRGVSPGAKNGTDPQGLIRQPFTYDEPSGGFLAIEADKHLKIQFVNDHGEVLHSVIKQAKEPKPVVGFTKIPR